MSATAATRDGYLATLPKRPYCVDRLGSRLCIRTRQKAAAFANIQHNAPMVWSWLMFDIDGDDAYDRAEDRGCPPPTFIALNRQNGHGHAGYLLASPVSAFTQSSRKAMRFFEDVERGLMHKLGADPSYPAFLSKNPLSARWETDWQAGIPYRLDVLNDCLDRSDKRKAAKREMSPVGRNASVFDAVRAAAYKQWFTFRKAGKTREEFEFMLRAVADGVNCLFPVKLSSSELRGITRSAAKWVWDVFSLDEFSDIQRARAQRRWSDAVVIQTLQPWRSEGISRATWYRRRKVSLSGAKELLS